MDVDTRFLLKQLEQEQVFIVGQDKQLASGGTLNLHVRNPSESGYAVFIPDVAVSTTGAATFKVYDGFDSITAGTEETVHNANLDSDGGEGASTDDGPIEAFVDSTFTPAENADTCGGVTGGGGFGGGGGLKFPPMRIEPGREIVLEVTNDSSNAQKSDIVLYAMI